MAKPKLLYASPFPPRETGIADHSAALVPGLADWFDITLLADDYQISDAGLRSRFPVLRHGIDEIQWGAYDHRLYHIGNNPWFHGNIYQACLEYPGTVVLHETVLYYLVAGVYQDRRDFYSKLFEIGGPQAVATVKSTLKQGKPALQCVRPEDAPLNRELLHSGNRIIVHSEYARQRVYAVSKDACVETVPLACVEPRQLRGFDRADFLTRNSIPLDATVITSFGFVAPTKLNAATCQAVMRFNSSHAQKVHYIMVGAGDYVARYINENIRVTGYVPQSEFEQYLHAADLVMNLRYPTMGETSIALLLSMWAGKPCVVSNLAWFSELPDDIALKLDAHRPELMAEQVYEAICLFMTNRALFHRTGMAGRAYVQREHSPQHVAKLMYGILEGASNCLGALDSAIGAGQQLVDDRIPADFHVGNGLPSRLSHGLRKTGSEP